MQRQVQVGLEKTTSQFDTYFAHLFQIFWRTDEPVLFHAREERVCSLTADRHSDADWQSVTVRLSAQLRRRCRVAAPIA